MKTTKLLSCTAIDLVLAAPSLTLAKSASVHHNTVKVHPLIKTSSVLHSLASPNIPLIKETTKTGVVDNTVNGMGTYKQEIVTAKNGVTVVNTTDTFNNGVVTDTITTTNKPVNGIYTENIENISGTGQITDTKERIDKLKNGTETITGVVITANGQVETLKGTETNITGGQDISETLTNSKSGTEALNIDVLKSQNASAWVETGTNFSGKSVDFASLSVQNTNAPITNAGINTSAGAFTYTLVPNAAGSITTRTYANGSSNVYADETTATGSTIDSSSINVNSNNTLYSSNSNETLTNTSTGANITGTFTQGPNGTVAHSGTIAGTETTTAYGSVTDRTYTDQNNVTKIADQQQLTIGNAILNVNTGTTFTGQANDNIGLINIASAR